MGRMPAALPALSTQTRAQLGGPSSQRWTLTQRHGPRSRSGCSRTSGGRTRSPDEQHRHGQQPDRAPAGRGCRRSARRWADILSGLGCPHGQPRYRHRAQSGPQRPGEPVPGLGSADDRGLRCPAEQGNPPAAGWSGSDRRAGLDGPACPGAGFPPAGQCHLSVVPHRWTGCRPGGGWSAGRAGRTPPAPPPITAATL